MDLSTPTVDRSTPAWHQGEVALWTDLLQFQLWTEPFQPGMGGWGEVALRTIPFQLQLWTYPLQPPVVGRLSHGPFHSSSNHGLIHSSLPVGGLHHGLFHSSSHHRRTCFSLPHRGKGLKIMD